MPCSHLKHVGLRYNGRGKGIRDLTQAPILTASKDPAVTFLSDVGSNYERQKIA